MYKKERKEHAFQAFSKDIKEDKIPAVLFLYGEEGYLIRWAVETLVRRYVNPALAALDYVHFRGEGEDTDGVLTACDTFSMMSERRVVWAEDFMPLKSANAKGFTKESLNRLEDYLLGPNDGTIFVLSCEEPEAKSELTKLLKKKAKCYHFTQLDRSALSGFINKRFTVAGVVPSKDVIHTIIDQSGYFNKETGYRIFHLVTDIEKIIAYCQGEQITVDAVSQVLNGDMDTFIFNLLDAVSDHQKEKAFTMLYHILQSGRDVYGIVAMLINQFELLLEVAELKKEGMNLSQITAMLQSSEFRIKKAMAFTEKFTVEKLKNVLTQLYEVDRNIKTGLLDQNLALEMLIGRI
ncbi:MAG: DNA polymerase III subunit delta [Firmicutes bacterium]|nr:DNA polymerase III subunit delta [Bacillota bacterium]